MRRDRALAGALAVAAAVMAFLGVVDTVVGVSPAWWVRLPVAVGVGSAFYLAHTGGTDGG